MLMSTVYRQVTVFASNMYGYKSFQWGGKDYAILLRCWIQNSIFINTLAVILPSGLLNFISHTLIICKNIITLFLKSNLWLMYWTLLYVKKNYTASIKINDIGTVIPCKRKP